MGKNKRRSSVSSVTQPPPPTHAVESLAPEILREGLRTIEKLQQGDCIMALKMIKKSISNHRHSPHLHFLEALVHHRQADKSAEDSEDKSIHLSKAVSSAKSAWENLPNSLCFALLFIDIIYQRATMEQEQWGFVIRQCEKALDIGSPTDPGVDKFLDEDEVQNSSKESRIEYEKKQIFKYLQASQYQASLIPDCKEVAKAVQANLQTIHDKVRVEMRIKDMEAIIGEWILKKQRASHFSIKKVKGNAEKVNDYKVFWSSRLNAEKKEDFQKVQIGKLESHLNSLGHYLVPDLREAISFAKEYRTWKYWECCNEKFVDCNMYRKHLRESHGSNHNLEEIKVRREWIEIILKGEWKPMATDMARKFIIDQLKLESYDASDSDTNVSSWPSCVDKNREEILDKVLQGIHLLHRNNCLAMTHLHWPILYAFDKFEIVIPPSQLCPETLKFICFLEASHLEDLLKFFDKLAVFCGLIKNLEMGSFLDDYLSDDTVSDMEERMCSSEDFSCLFVHEDNILLENEDLVSWLYESRMTGDDLESQTSLRDSQREKAELVVKIFEIGSLILPKVCKRRENIDFLQNIEKIKVLERIYLEETKKREKDQWQVAHFFFNLLTKGHKDIQSYESGAISSILNEALEAASSYQSRHEECDLEDELGKQKERLTEIDNRLRLTLQRMQKKLTEDLALADALALSCAAAVQKHQQVLEKITFYDYQSTVVPLLMSYLQTNLENLFHKDAADAFLAELNAEEGTKIGRDSVRQKQKNNRNNKKKNFRMAEESKGINGGKNSQVHQKDGEDDNRNPEIEDSMSFDEVKESIATHGRLSEECSEDHNKSETDPALKVNVLGTNEALDCFLNVIIRSLWHLIEFREELMSRSKACHMHNHENACIFCALEVIFAALSKESADKEREAADPIFLRAALITHTSLMKKEEMHDAYDCMRVILESLHDSIITVLKPEDQFDCFIADCFVHRIFGWDHHERIYCGDCDLESGHRKTTSLFLILSVINFSMMKAEDAHRDSSFDELLKFVGMNERITCNQCRKWKDIYHTIRCLPPVFTMVLAWPNQVQSSEYISTTWSALSAELNLSVIFQGHHPDSEYLLVSVVCFYGDREHYVCFNYDQVLEKYVLYDDTIVEVTGSWENVIDTCNTSHLKPVILFFNQKSRMKFGHLQSQ